MSATLRFSLHERSIPGPTFSVPHAVGDRGPHYGTMGLDADLMEGARTAVRNMIWWLGAEKGMSPADAYILCSLAGDLRIHEVVDAGVWNVGMTLPLNVFV
jgi:acetamidase/formamidase